jgi:hypothetical protein
MRTRERIATLGFCLAISGGLAACGGDPTDPMAADDTQTADGKADSVGNRGASQGYITRGQDVLGHQVPSRRFTFGNGFSNIWYDKWMYNGTAGETIDVFVATGWDSPMIVIVPPSRIANGIFELPNTGYWLDVPQFSGYYDSRGYYVAESVDWNFDEYSDAWQKTNFTLDETGTYNILVTSQRNFHDNRPRAGGPYWLNVL